jgi:hypothetical protein
VGGLEGNWGYIDRASNFVISPRFDKALGFSKGLAAVKDGGENGKWGFIDKSGTYVINPRYDIAGDFY